MASGVFVVVVDVGVVFTSVRIVNKCAVPVYSFLVFKFLVIEFRLNVSCFVLKKSELQCLTREHFRFEL